MQWEHSPKYQGWYKWYSLGNVLSNRILTQESLPLGSWNKCHFFFFTASSQSCSNLFITFKCRATPHPSPKSTHRIKNFWLFETKGDSPYPYCQCSPSGTSEKTPSFSHCFFTRPKRRWRARAQPSSPAEAEKNLRASSGALFNINHLLPKRKGHMARGRLAKKWYFSSDEIASLHSLLTWLCISLIQFMPWSLNLLILYTRCHRISNRLNNTQKKLSIKDYKAGTLFEQHFLKLSIYSSICMVNSRLNNLYSKKALIISGFSNYLKMLFKKTHKTKNKLLLL